ncbi:hypothetical protein GH733_002559 [Mirounga leonina]|nr:hypothetical protein GH733_002559 [Mirounga leonina]
MSELSGGLGSTGDTHPQEMIPSKKSAVLVDGVVLNGPTTDARAGEKFVEEAWKLIMEEVVLKATDVNEKVCEWRPPEQLKQLLDLEMRDTGEPPHRLLELCQDVIRYSVKTMEEAVLKKMIEFIGWKEGDGIFNPGGSVSNMYAMNLARYKYCPDIKEKGLSGLPRLILFTSAECHYSMKKAASFLGIGTENVCFVETDGRGKMIPAELERQIWQASKEGAAPFLVCATSGTTVLGAFDPLDEIADICERHGLWLHVDASWGGSALMSRKYRKLLQGIHRADSVAWNPHKMLMAGIQCCALLVKDKSEDYVDLVDFFIMSVFICLFQKLFRCIIDESENSDMEKNEKTTENVPGVETFLADLLELHSSPWTSQEFILVLCSSINSLKGLEWGGKCLKRNEVLDMNMEAQEDQGRIEFSCKYRTYRSFPLLAQVLGQWFPLCGNQTFFCHPESCFFSHSVLLKHRLSQGGFWLSWLLYSSLLYPSICLACITESSLLPIFQLSVTYFFSRRVLSNVSESDLLKKCYSAKASYLFQQDKFYDVSYDTGDKSIQCSRRPDAFKFWMTWKALGTLGLEERVNQHTENRWRNISGVLGGSMHQKTISNEEVRLGEKVGPECSKGDPGVAEKGTERLLPESKERPAKGQVKGKNIRHNHLTNKRIEGPQGWKHICKQRKEKYLVEEIKKREGFKLLLEPEYANICFWYIPPSLREMEEGPEFWAKLNLCVSGTACITSLGDNVKSLNPVPFVSVSPSVLSTNKSIFCPGADKNKKRDASSGFQLIIEPNGLESLFTHGCMVLPAKSLPLNQISKNCEVS